VQKFSSSSPQETRDVGKKLIELFGKKQIYCLYGPLAAGKTTLVKGMARALNVNRTVVSPSYILLREYVGDSPLFHLDLFRLTDSSEIIEAGLDEYLVDPHGVVAVEWADRAEEILPSKRIDIKIKIGKKNQREFQVKNPTQGTGLV